MTLAGRLEQNGEYDKAVAEYKAILAYAPNEAATLNNLAYVLATQKDAAAEALPLAERARVLSRDDSKVLDTLAWTLHLLGRDRDALPSMASARASSPTNADIRWHFAVILAALGDNARARQELDAFLKLAPDAADQPDVKELDQRLKPQP